MRVEIKNDDAARLRRIRIDGKSCGRVDLAMNYILDLLKEEEQLASLKERIRHNLEMKKVLEKELKDIELNKETTIKNVIERSSNRLKKCGLQVKVLELEIAGKGDGEECVAAKNELRRIDLCDLNKDYERYEKEDKEVAVNARKTLVELEKVKKAQLVNVEKENERCEKKIALMEEFNG